MIFCYLFISSYLFVLYDLRRLDKMSSDDETNVDFYFPEPPKENPSGYLEGRYIGPPLPPRITDKDMKHLNNKELVQRVCDCGKNYYAIFGHFPYAKELTVSMFEIRRKELKKRLHPDKNKEKGALEAFKLVIDAEAQLEYDLKCKPYSVEDVD